MGWWTLGGHAGQPVTERVAAELSGEVLRIEEQRAHGETTIHALVKIDGATHWAVALVNGHGLVKIMGEDVGPYCAKCSRAFLEAAREACGDPPGSFAADFRERMAA